VPNKQSETTVQGAAKHTVVAVVACCMPPAPAHLHGVCQHWRQLIGQLEHAGLLLLLNHVLLALPHTWGQLRWGWHAQQPLPELLLQALAQLQATQQTRQQHNRMQAQKTL